MAFCERRTDYDHLDPLRLRQYNDCSDQFERRDRGHLCTPEYAYSEFCATPDGRLTAFDPRGAYAGNALPNALNDRGTVAGTFDDCIHSASYTFVFLRFPDGTFTSFLPAFF